jgi:hypothetical protein
MKHKRRAVFVLFVVGSLLALVSAWDLPEDANRDAEEQFQDRFQELRAA